MKSFLRRQKFAFVILIVSTLTVKAQQQFNDYRLPDLSLGTEYSGGNKEVSLHSFKKSLVIITLWSTSCSAGIGNFGRLDRLQKAYPDQVQFLLVNKETGDSTRRYLFKNRKVKLPSLPMFTDGSIFWKMFPITLGPVSLVMDNQFVIRDIVLVHQLTPKRIQAYLQGYALDVSLELPKRPEQVFLQDTLEAVVGTPVGYFSYLSRCSRQRDIGNRNRQDRKRHFLSLSQSCASVTELYKKAFDENGKYNFRPGLTLLCEFGDSLRYFRPRDADEREDWIDQHTYNYEVRIPGDEMSKLYGVMQEDLQRYFGLAAVIEKRKRPCLILTLDRTGEKWKRTFFPGQKPSPDSIYFLNRPFNSVSRTLQADIETNTNFSFVDETGLVDKVNLRFSAESLRPINILSLRRELANYGLTIIEGERDIEVLVLRKNILAEKPKREAREGPSLPY